MPDLYLHQVEITVHKCRAAKRIEGAQGKYKKWGLAYGLCEGSLGHAPRKF